jgi:hypothetical protein
MDYDNPDGSEPDEDFVEGDIDDDDDEDEEESSDEGEKRRKRRKKRDARDSLILMEAEEDEEGDDDEDEMGEDEEEAGRTFQFLHIWSHLIQYLCNYILRLPDLGYLILVNLKLFFSSLFELSAFAQISTRILEAK